MKRTDLAIGTITLLAGVIAAAALLIAAQAQPRAAAEASSASPAPAASAEPVAPGGDPMPHDEVEARGGEAVGGAPLPEPGAPAVGGSPVESADAAIAIALRDRASIQEATSTDAIRTTPEEAYGDEGLLAGSGLSPVPDDPSTDGLWLVGVTGDIRNSYGAVAVPLDWRIVVIDARSGSITSTWSDTGTLPDIFD